MSLPDPKAIKKLADTCRKAGIRHFKSADFEFTLTDELPAPRKRVTSTQSGVDSNNTFESDSLDAEALLYWSVNEEIA